MARPPDDRRRPHGEAGLGELVKDYLDAQFDALVIGERAISEGRMEFVHPTRVATRRYRTVLKDMGGLFDPATALVLEESLRWYARVLGDVRDLQVARRELEEAIDRVPDQLAVAAVRAAVDDYLTVQERSATSALRGALTTHRYTAMVEQMRVWHDDLPVDDEQGDHDAPGGRDTPSAAVDDAIKPYVKRARRRLQRRLDAAERAGNPDALLHDARKAAKRARYVAELAEPALGKKARATVKRMTAVQDDLGSHQDQTLVGQLLLDMARQESVGFHLGVLYASLVPGAGVADGPVPDDGDDPEPATGA